MLLPFNAQVFFYRKSINFRKQIDGIIILVADTLEKNPISAQLFVFWNKSSDKIKILYWDDNGFWPFYKWFENARF
ncbi:MAG: transposase [Oleiphilaceae bacterium]|jgi:transposase